MDFQRGQLRFKTTAHSEAVSLSLKLLVFYESLWTSSQFGVEKERGSRNNDEETFHQILSSIPAH